MGELILRARSADDLDAWISFMNGAGVDNKFNPVLYGQQSATGKGSAIYSVANIDALQDLVTNLSPVSSFYASQNWQPNVNGVQRINVVQNRKIYGWHNGPDRLMTMDARGYLGLATATPGNRLEINSDFYDATGNPGTLVTWQTANLATPIPGGANPTGFSGLRFSDLKSGSIPQLNPGTGVLSVNANGDIILVGSANTIGTCTAPTMLGTNNGAVNLNGNNFYFLNGTSANYKNKVSIGYPCSSPVEGKLNVLETDPNSVTGRSFAGYFENIADGDTKSFGVASSVHGTVSKKVGVWGVAYQSSLIDLIPPPANQVGVSGIALEGNSNIGIYGQAPLTASGTNWAGYFKGDVHINGSGTITGSAWAASDSILKTNIETISNARNMISQLKSRKYNYNTAQYPYLNLPEGIQFGLIAEDVQTVLPNLVKNITYPGQRDSAGNVTIPELTYLGLNYTALIPIAIKGIQELDSTLSSYIKPPLPPVLIAPANGATSLMREVTFNWHPSKKAVTYKLIIATSPDSVSIIKTVTTSDTTLSLFKEFLPGTTYYWAVIAINSNGNSQLSGIWNFTLTSPLLPPALFSHVNGVVNIPVKGLVVSWHPSVAALNYTLYISGSPHEIINPVSNVYEIKTER